MASKRAAGEQPVLSGLTLWGQDLHGLDFEGVRLERVVFSRGRTEDDPARLEGANLRGATLVECKLARCDLSNVDLRGAVLKDCDLRYVTTRRTNFDETEIRGCDFYRAYFDAATIFSPAVLERVSLGRAALGGLTAITREHFENRPLIQELDLDHYRKFLRETEADSPPETLETRARGRIDQAAQTYRALSALWASQGLLGDSGWAYARSREYERRSASSRRREPRQLLKWIGLTLANAICGYGLRLERVVASIAALVLLPAGLFALLGGIEDNHIPTRRFGQTLIYSAGHLAGTAPDRLKAVHAAAEVAAIGQTFVGIALLGLLGFVLGNVIRSA